MPDDTWKSGPFWAALRTQLEHAFSLCGLAALPWTAEGGCPYIILVGREGARLHPEGTPLHYVIERGAQAAMIIILDCHEAERLQYAVVQLTRRAEDFRHPVYRAGLCLEGNLDEVALAQRLWQAQQASGYRDGLEFRFRAAAIFKTNRSQN